MDLQLVLVLLGAGLVGGSISAVVGGSNLITFPSLVTTGLSPVIATASNIVALTPGNFVAALCDRSQLPEFNSSFVASYLHQ
jgi:uncharacterized membrane protein YfcA